MLIYIGLKVKRVAAEVVIIDREMPYTVKVLQNTEEHIIRNFEIQFEENISCACYVMLYVLIK